MRRPSSVRRLLTLPCAVALASLPLSLAHAAPTEEAASEPGKPTETLPPPRNTERPAIAGIGLGLSADSLWRRHSDGAFFALPGVAIELKAGRRMSRGYVTGLKVRGTWSLPFDFDLKDDAGDAENNQLLDATLAWYHELGARTSAAARFGLGPHLSVLQSASNNVYDSSLLGAELSLEFRPSVWDLHGAWSGSLWLGLRATHSRATGDDDAEAHERETSVGLTVDFELENAF